MIKLVFQSENFVLVDKPAGYLSVPSRMGVKDQRPCVGILLEHQLGCKVYPTHRLDLEVSGLLLFALTPEAHREANLAFEKHFFKKKYEAVTEIEAEATYEMGTKYKWQSKILRGKKRAYESPAGKLAVTSAIPIKKILSKEGVGLLAWALEPLTGRGHQLRFELSRRGFPVVGDVLYGSSVSLSAMSSPVNGIALRAVELSLVEDESNLYRLLKELPSNVRIERSEFGWIESLV